MTKAERMMRDPRTPQFTAGERGLIADALERARESGATLRGRLAEMDVAIESILEARPELPGLPNTKPQERPDYA